MPRKFERPANLPEKIPIYHTTPRDSDADLLLKITAMKTNKTAVLPVYREDMIDYLPDYFGKLFDKNRNYEFKENQLQKDEYFEIKIPNVDDPKNVALLFEKAPAFYKNDKKEVQHILNYFTSDVLFEFYWIANYFNYDKFLNHLVPKLVKENQNFCIDRAVEFGFCPRFVKANNKFWSEEKDKRVVSPHHNYLVKKLLNTDFDLTLERLDDIRDMQYDIELCMKIGPYYLPFEIDINQAIQFVRKQKNVYLDKEICASLTDENFGYSKFGSSTFLQKQLGEDYLTSENVIQFDIVSENKENPGELSILHRKTGWRLASKEDFEKYSLKVKKTFTTSLTSKKWYTVRLQDNFKLGGPGYNYFIDSIGEEGVGHMLIMRSYEEELKPGDREEEEPKKNSDHSDGDEIGSHYRDSYISF